MANRGQGGVTYFAVRRETYGMPAPGTQKTVSPAAGGSVHSYVPCQAQIAPQPVLSTSSLEVVDAMIVQR